jgi:hypothetical protein
MIRSSTQRLGTPQTGLQRLATLSDSRESSLNVPQERKTEKIFTAVLILRLAKRALKQSFSKGFTRARSGHRNAPATGKPLVLA